MLRYSNVMTPEELLDGVEREGLKEDMLEECRKFGKVEIPLKPLALTLSPNPNPNILTLTPY